jgi:hypothetical protein
MAARRLGSSRLSGKQPPFPPATKLSGKLTPYVPRGAQYDYKPPSVFARYKVLTAIFVILLVSLLGYWAIGLGMPRAVRQAARQAAQQPAPPSDPVYIEPLTPK